MEGELSYLYRDSELVVVNKPAGMIVHPHRRQRSSGFTLMKQVRDDLEQYVYPVHRLDRPVSGCTVFALTKKAARSLKENWHNNETVKEYLAFCFGQPPIEGVWEDSLKNHRGGDHDHYQLAKTKFRCLYKFPAMADVPPLSLMKIQIRSGRKHQIRRHFAHHHFPLVGDLTYGVERWNQTLRDRFQLKGLMLHAFQLSFVHPSNLEMVNTRAELPAYFREVLQVLLKDMRKVLEIIENQKH